MNFEELFDKYESEVEAIQTLPEEPEGPQNASEDEGGTSTTQDDVGPAKLATFFGLNEFEVVKVKDKLREIYRFASEQGGDPLSVLSRLEGRLGAPKYEKSKLDHFYEYIKTFTQAQGLVERLRGYGNTDSTDRSGGDSGKDTSEDGGGSNDAGGESRGGDGGTD